MFLFFFLSLIGTVYGYVGWRFIGPLEIEPATLALVACAVLIMGLLPPTILLFRHRLQHLRWHDQLCWLTYMSMGCFAMTFCLLLVRDIIWSLWEVAELLVTFASMSAETAGDINPGLRGGSAKPTDSNHAVLILSLSICVYGFWQARRTPRVNEIEIPVSNLPEALQDFRIAHLSDIHIGPTIKKDFVTRVSRAVASTRPDLIVFTGDLADGTVALLADQAEPLADLQAPCGKYFVTGNHEYYSGVKPWLEIIEKLGFCPLLNEHRTIEWREAKIVIAGATDASAYNEGGREHASDPRAAISGAPDADVRILLTHQPRSALQVESDDVDLQLSGHTHGGQFLPWHLFVKLQQPYLAGLYRRGTGWIYVNRGAGYWGPPLRVGAPSEVALLSLTRADGE